MPKGQNTASQCHQPGITGTVQWAPPTESFPNNTKPWIKARALTPLREENYHVSWPERPSGPLSCAELLTQVLEWAAGGP